MNVVKCSEVWKPLLYDHTVATARVAASLCARLSAVRQCVLDNAELPSANGAFGSGEIVAERLELLGRKPVTDSALRVACFTL